MIGDYYKSGNWKGEKHVPVITAPEKVKAEDFFDITIEVGKEIPHPNTLEHHIGWIKLYFLPKGTNIVVELGDYNFSAHGELNSFTHPKTVTNVALKESGTLIATSYCNIHGLWESSQEITVE